MSSCYWFSSGFWLNNLQPEISEDDVTAFEDYVIVEQAHFDITDPEVTIGAQSASEVD